MDVPRFYAARRYEPRKDRGEPTADLVNAFAEIFASYAQRAAPSLNGNLRLESF